MPAMAPSALLSAAHSAPPRTLTPHFLPPPPGGKEQPLVSAVGGAIAGAVSLSVCYPLYTMVIRMQALINARSPRRRRLVSDETPEAKAARLASRSSPWTRIQRQLLLTVRVARKIYKEDGLLGFYPGLRGAILATTMQSAVYYYWLHVFKKLGRAGGSPLLQMKAAAQAGTAAVIITTPLWVCNTRMILSEKSRIGSVSNLLGLAGKVGSEKRRGWVSTLVDIVKTDGIFALWSGLGPSLLLVANPSVQSGAEALLRGIWRRVRRRQDLDDGALLFIGAAAKIAATFATYPIQTIRTNQSTNARRSAYEVALNLVEQGGLGSLFSGVWTKLLQSATTAAVASLVRERATEFLASKLA